MTGRTPSTASRRHPLLLSALAAFILAVVWVAYFLITFDLNNYRHQAEQSLSALLSLPVKMNDIHYNFHDTNLALHVAGLQIGDDGSATKVDAPDIFINLKWWGLLERSIKFAKISVVGPRIWVRAVSHEQTAKDGLQEGTSPTILNQALLQSISIDNLEILAGTVQIETSRPGQPAEQIDITEIEGELAGIKLNHAAQLTMNGNLRVPGQKGPSSWQLQGESSLAIGEGSALEPHFNLDLNAKDLDLLAIRTFFSGEAADYSIEGISNLHLHLEESPEGGIDFQTGLSSDNITLFPGGAYTRPIFLKNFLASGHLQAYGDHPGISDLSLQVDESRLAGSIAWTPDGQPFSTTVTLLNSSLAVSQLKQWLPGHQKAGPSIQQDLLDQGALQVELAEFTLHGKPGTQREWRIDRLKGEFQQMIWSHGKLPAVEITSLPFDFANDLWQINNGRGRWGALQLAVKGTAQQDKNSIMLTSVDFNGEALPSALLEEWQITRHSLAVTGNLGFSGHLEGPLDQLTLDLQADLSQLGISHPDGLTLTPGQEDKLTIHGSLSPEKINLEHAALKWSVAKGHLSGSLLRNDPDSLAVDGLLTISDISRLAEALPLLEKLQLHGQADLSIRQRGLPGENFPEAVLTLRDAGLHATRHIADLSQINGRVQLTPTGLTAENLRVHLGQSPLTVRARLEDFAKPRLFLDVEAPSVRADELIFYSKTAMLRDINGHMEIDRDGLTFAPVAVRLDGGTNATVRGTISFHAPFNVQLDIASEFARIGEVISLWADHPETSTKHPGLTGDKGSDFEPQATIKITARVKEGDLYGMSFHDASGLIAPSHQRLVIHPLDFSVGDGFCNAQVITEFSTGGATQLRISGHAEDVDALEVYRELLNQKNIVRGKLRGDFYLSGEIGSNYLPSSYGNFNIQIHDGVLHQFAVLSKVFSLLNVSQIFALQLPDMDAEGMPFDTLSANFQLDKGLLKSTDLKIQSEAMNQSYGGQLDLIHNVADFSIAIQPLGTVDKIISRIPIAGWLLTGEDKALLTAHFNVKGKISDVSVEALPLDTLTEPTIGLLRRTLELPFKLIEDPQILWGGEGGKE